MKNKMRDELVEFSEFTLGWFGEHGPTDGEPFKEEDINFAHSVSQKIDALGLEYILFPSPDNEISFDFQVEKSLSEKHWMMTVDLRFETKTISLHNYNIVSRESLHLDFSFNELDKVLTMLEKIKESVK